ncbi:MAG: hypothetical protein ABIY40_03865 [Rhodanobacteraceae bacterium]|nr:hypothetical protein [Pseudomonadota bacterium]
MNNDSVFIHFEFWLLLLASLVLPVVIYFALLSFRRISRYTVLLFALALILLSALDVFLLRHLANAAHATPSIFDDKVFASEFSLALYLLPLLSAGIGVNIISDVLLNHLRRVAREPGAEPELDHRRR